MWSFFLTAAVFRTCNLIALTLSIWRASKASDYVVIALVKCRLSRRQPIAAFDYSFNCVRSGSALVMKHWLIILGYFNDSGRPRWTHCGLELV